MASAKRAATRRRTAGKAGSATLSAAEVEQLVNVLSEFSETTITKADIDLALDDRGWIRNGAQAQALAEWDMVTRRQMIAKSRLYWYRDPLAKQAVRLWTDYSINTGCTFSITADADDADAAEEGAAPPPETDTEAEEPPAQAALNAFWNDRRNRKYTSPEGQRQLSKRMLVDGELFFVIMDTASGPVLRKVDCIEITDFIKDPDDSDCVMAYRREAEVNGKKVVQYYRDWACSDEDAAQLQTMKGPQQENIAALLRDDCVMYHAPFDCFKDRGNPLLSTVVDWSKEHRRFMESRVNLLQALAKFAYKITAKGGQKSVDKLAGLMQSTFHNGIGTGIERNPKTASGSTWVQNQGADIEAMPRSSGGAESKADGDQLKLMVSAGTGIMLHYFGDPSTGNLATSTAMELPMLKQFEAYQAQWQGIWRDIFSIILGEEPEDDEAQAAIDIDYPPIVQADLVKLAQAVASFTAAFPEMKVEPVLTMILVAMGINNVKEVMELIEQKRTEIDANNAQQFQQQLAIAQKQPPVDPKTGQPAAPPVAAKESDAVRLAAAIERMCAVMEG